MDIKNNFLSVVTLGSFNPAILTPDFLKMHEIFSDVEHLKGRSSPVVSEIIHNDIHFLAELERFQITHRKIRNFNESDILDSAVKYLEVLEYTPLLAQGINFNVDINDYDDSPIIKEILGDPVLKFCKYIGGIDDFLIDLKVEVVSGNKETKGINFKYFIEDGIVIAINMNKANDKIVLNYNQEVKNINSDRDRIKIIRDRYSDIITNFNDFINTLKG